MCDTMVATPDVTANGCMLFAKNSDREPNEAQALERVPRHEHEPGPLQLTYITIPQVKETNEVLLSRPFHMWGAEMGANEHGLVIGNEALFTRVKLPKKDSGMTGMDMLRLALERTATAEQALELITGLVESYSQDACGGYRDRGFYYHSSFIIADAREAFVLETAAHQWAAVRVNGFRSISNGFTIESEYDFASDNLIEFARKQGWAKKHSAGEFNFRESYSDFFMTRMSKSSARQQLSMSCGVQAQGKLTSQGMMQILRTHGSSDQQFVPSSSGMDSLCLHASGITTPSQTTASMVAEVRPEQPSTFWLTGTAAPCISLFKPFFVPGKNITNEAFAPPGAEADGSLWWRGEALHRLVLRNYSRARPMFAGQRDAIEAEFLNQEGRYIARGASPDELDAFSSECLERGDRALRIWIDTVEAADLKPDGWKPLYSFYRSRLNRAAGLKGHV